MPLPSPRHASNPSLEALGAAIRKVRKAQGISQEGLAHQAGIDRSYMSSIERGMQNPGIVTVLAIARALDLTATELMAHAEL